ncbi:MAG: transporter substrate-binding domain-containing protein, partial [Clostridia bacterium]|nr:transporter substrate-binding domain-containing protein [Clostridia bacterium]
IKEEHILLQHTELKVGIVRGYYYGEHYEKLVKKLRDRRMIVEVRDTRELYSALKDGWVQATINIPSSYLFYFKTMNIENIAVVDWAPEEKPLQRQLALSRSFFTEKDVKDYTKCIEDMRQDGTLYAIYKKYLPEDETKRMCEY